MWEGVEIGSAPGDWEGLRAIVIAHDLEFTAMHRDHVGRPEAERKLRMMLRRASIVHANRSSWPRLRSKQ